MDIIGKGVGVEPGTRLVLSVKSPHLAARAIFPHFKHLSGGKRINPHQRVDRSATTTLTATADLQTTCRSAGRRKSAML